MIYLQYFPRTAAFLALENVEDLLALIRQPLSSSATPTSSHLFELCAVLGCGLSNDDGPFPKHLWQFPASSDKKLYERKIECSSSPSPVVPKIRCLVFVAFRYVTCCDCLISHDDLGTPSHTLFHLARFLCMAAR